MRHGLILREKPLPLKAFIDADMLSPEGLFEGLPFARSMWSPPSLADAAAIKRAMTRPQTDSGAGLRVGPSRGAAAR
jgi:hypothetical protein